MTTISLDPAAPGGGGYYADAVRVTVSATDDRSTFTTRCVLDPLVPPASFEDLPPGCPYVVPTFVGAGVHTVFAASRDAAGNSESPVVSRSFRVLQVPDTTITDGPAATSWSRNAKFAFVSSIAGSTFECRLAGGSWTPCASPYTTPSLGIGGQGFEVRAISPQGAVDPTPAQWAWTVPATTTTRSPGCRVRPMLADGWVDICVFRQAPGCASTFYMTCVHTDEACPRGAWCTLTGRIDYREADAEVRQSGSVIVGFGANRNRLAALRTRTCIADYDASGCSASVATRMLGTGEPVWVECQMGDSSYFEHTPIRRGPDSERILDCAFTLKIEPAAPLQPLAISASVVQLLVPSAGKLLLRAKLPAARPRGAVAASAGSSKASFAPVELQVAEGGPVSVKLRPNRGARSLLARRKSLAVTIQTTFTPPGGSATATTKRVTLAATPKQPPMKRRAKRTGLRR